MLLISLSLPSWFLSLILLLVFITIHRALSQHPTVNDDLPNRILSGLVKVKGNVKEFTERAAIFEDGSREDDIDVVIFATGYSFAFPFLKDVVKTTKNKILLYKKVFPPNLEKPTLAIIGLIQPLGALMPISELQGRWVTQVFKGKWPCKLTSYLVLCFIMFMILILNSWDSIYDCNRAWYKNSAQKLIFSLNIK